LGMGSGVVTDVVAEDLAMTFRSTFSQTFAALSTSYASVACHETASQQHME